MATGCYGAARLIAHDQTQNAAPYLENRYFGYWDEQATGWLERLTRKTAQASAIAGGGVTLAVVAAYDWLLVRKADRVTISREEYAQLIVSSMTSGTEKSCRGEGR
jgi:hypothetical protein